MTQTLDTLSSKMKLDTLFSKIPRQVLRPVKERVKAQTDIFRVHLLLLHLMTMLCRVCARMIKVTIIPGLRLDILECLSPPLVLPHSSAACAPEPDKLLPQSLGRSDSQGPNPLKEPTNFMAYSDALHSIWNILLRSFVRMYACA